MGGWFVCADFYAEWWSFAPLDGVGKGGARVCDTKVQLLLLSRHEPRKKKNRIKLKDNFEKSSRSFQSLDWRV